MKFNLKQLELSLRKGSETIDFTQLTYFWGRMGAGKTSIARLVDYCLGASIQLSNALQSEFNSAKLTVELAAATVTLERPRESNNILANWDGPEGPYSVLVPARTAAGEVIPESGVETLSDLLFWLSNINPPRVRKSKTKADSATVRLSMRELFWYCYLDQDHLDSDFFYLEEDAEFYRRLKSRDVLRYVVGYHDESVAELEAELDLLNANRVARAASIDSLTKTLAEVGVESEEQIKSREEAIRTQIAEVEVEIERIRRSQRDAQSEHAADNLRSRSKVLATEIEELRSTQDELLQTRDRNLRHRNELDTLGLKFKRSAVAREILGGVHFENCPRCAQTLPSRKFECCAVCGQDDTIELTDPAEIAALEKDIAIRRQELDEAINTIDANVARMKSLQREAEASKRRAEIELNRVLQERDSAYLSTALQKERERAALTSSIENLQWLMRLPKMLQEQREELAEIVGLEQVTRQALKDARGKAESDRTNLNRFAEYFLDCLVRAGIPGMQRSDQVVLEPPTFYPQVSGSDPDDLTAATFKSLSSGGKKTLFKCCFALALHRVAAQLNAPLPQLLIIDSPMKNISERENKEQFEGFYKMVYELKASELANTQIILIDKELFGPPADIDVAIRSRHMRPDDAEHPPLIRYYRGR